MPRHAGLGCPGELCGLYSRGPLGLIPLSCLCIVERETSTPCVSGRGKRRAVAAGAPLPAPHPPCGPGSLLAVCPTASPGTRSPCVCLLGFSGSPCQGWAVMLGRNAPWCLVGSQQVADGAHLTMKQAGLPVRSPVPLSVSLGCRGTEGPSFVNLGSTKGAMKDKPCLVPSREVWPTSLVPGPPSWPAQADRSCCKVTRGGGCARAT